jgi:hypothetical protein
VTSERISTTGVLEVVAKAGRGGIVSGDIAANFSEPESLVHRLNCSNGILNRHWIRDHTRRSATREPSRRGQHAYRWYITPSGIEFLRGEVSA